tara:strand:+ start:1171 stop:1482 length:312 start_codon:yes stop_codon:yes gene_type:complete
MRELKNIDKSFDTDTQGYLNTTAKYEIEGSIRVYENQLVRTRENYAGYCEKTNVRTNCFYTLYVKDENGNWEKTGSGYYQEHFIFNEDGIAIVHNNILSKILD